MKNTSNKYSNKVIRTFNLFIIIYLFLYILPFPLHYIPIIGKYFTFFHDGMEVLTIWVGKNLVGLYELKKIKFTGSGDTLFNYVEVLTCLLISFLLTITFILFPKITSRKFSLFVRTYARYFLAFALLSYGTAKLFEGQFSFPSLERLDQKIGESSPMGLLWTFMGYSKLYTVFGGICQITAGLLLLFRRFSALGSLMALAVMSNIVVLNFAYDVPVKLYSLHLAFISLFILSPNFSVLFNFFFLKKKVQLLSDVPLIPKKEIGYVILALKAFIVVGYLCVVMISGTRYLSKAKENNLNGIYHVESFFSKDKSLNQWHKFIITDRYATVFYNEKKHEDFNITIDTLQNNVILQSKKDSLKSGNLTYLSSAENKMDFKGIFENDSISVQSSIKRKKEFELVKRSFNWINDYPYNK